MHSLQSVRVKNTPLLCRRYLEVIVGQSPPERPVYLLGESFGGVLALAVARERPDLVDRVVLVNPATSFQRSPWPMLGPLLPRVPKVAPTLLLPVYRAWCWRAYRQYLPWHTPGVQVLAAAQSGSSQAGLQQPKIIASQLVLVGHCMRAMHACSSRC